jgi:hypothetical protein
MQRLKHPIRSIREPFGKAGLTVAILALVLAMVGGAWAAAGLTGKQKKQVIKIAKKYAGKPGAVGANGTNGTNGTEGKEGKEGAKGKSVALGAAGANCTTPNGTSVEVEGSGTKQYVCNGKNGTTGYTEFLPKGKTETGSYSAISTSTTKAVIFSISFPIPLEAKITETHFVTYEDQHNNTIPAGCSGTAQEPQASPGNLCVFSNEAFTEPFNSPPVITPAGTLSSGAGTTGVVGLGETKNAEEPIAGTWAVTAPE